MTLCDFSFNIFWGRWPKRVYVTMCKLSDMLLEDMRRKNAKEKKKVCSCCLFFHFLMPGKRLCLEVCLNQYIWGLNLTISSHINGK